MFLWLSKCRIVGLENLRLVSVTDNRANKQYQVFLSCWLMSAADENNLALWRS